MTTSTPESSLATLFREGRIDRRELVRRAALLGVSAPAIGAILAGAGSPATAAAAQGEASAQLVTVSNESTGTWTRAFNPLIPGQRWPTGAGIYEPLAIRNQVSGELVPWLAES